MDKMGKTVVLYQRGHVRSLMMVNLEQWPAEPVIQTETIRLVDGTETETSGICANGLFDQKYLTYRASVWYR